MKKVLLALAVLASSLTATAQSYKGTSFEDRIGHGQDSIDVRGALSMYVQCLKEKNYGEAYEHWKFVMEKAPLAQVRIYKEGQTILQEMTKKETDATKKKAYFDELMALYDLRLKNLNDLNDIATKEIDISSRGFVICRKAYDSYYFNPVQDNAAAVASYDLFHKGIADTGRDTEAGVLWGFTELSDYLYKSDPDKYREDYLNDYMTTVEVCQSLLAMANEYPVDSIPGDPTSADSTKWETQIILDPKAQRIIDYYQPTLDHAEDLFVKSGAADCDALEKIYVTKIEANKTNLDYLNGVLKLLSNFDCDKSDIYYKASDYAYEIKKTPQAAIGRASKCLKSGDSAGAIKYFDEAISLEPETAKKAKYAYAIAALMYKRGNTSGCLQYINKTLQYNPSNGGAYLLKASIVARSGSRKSIEATAPFCLAIDICNQAKAKDPSCSARANRAIASYSANLYPRSEAFMQGFKAGQRVSTAYGSTTIRFR